MENNYPQNLRPTTKFVRPDQDPSIQLAHIMEEVGEIARALRDGHMELAGLEAADLQQSAETFIANLGFDGNYLRGSVVKKNEIRGYYEKPEPPSLERKLAEAFAKAAANMGARWKEFVGSLTDTYSKAFGNPSETLSKPFPNAEIAASKPFDTEAIGAAATKLKSCKLAAKCKRRGPRPSLTRERILSGLHPDTPVKTNDQGGSQSASPYCFIDLDPLAVLAIAQRSGYGREKYGLDNWRKIPSIDHIDHALAHLHGHLAGDTSDDHLPAAAWRVIAALGVYLEEQRGEVGTYETDPF